MKKLKRITDAFLDDMRSWHECPTPLEINGGDCYNWAWIVNKLIPESELGYTPFFGGHAWVIVKGLYYDSEAIAGVSCWTKLPCLLNRKIKPSYRYLGSKEFEEYWDINKKQNKRILNVLRA